MNGRRAFLGLLLLAMPVMAMAQERGEPQALVDRATLSVQEMMTEGDPPAVEDARRLLRRARAVVVCPQVFRAGFILGGQGGGCVMLGRDAAGSWSAPAFYGLSSASLGFQIGMQDMQIMMLIMNEPALVALMDSQFKFGADASLSVATIGAGIAGATTSAAGADIVAIARARGLFAGIALEGSLLTARSGWNQAYYGQEFGPRQIVLAMQANNPGADPLRGALMRHGGDQAPPPPPPRMPPPQALSPQASQPEPVQSTTLPPIARPQR